MLKKQSEIIAITGLMVFVLGLGNLCMGQSYWKQTYAGGIRGILPTSDGNFLIAGFIDPDDRLEDGWLLKIKPNGDTVWTKRYGGTGYNFFSAIQSSTDGNYLIAGETDCGSVENFGWLIKIRSNGDTIWTKMYSGNEIEYVSAFKPTTDGNFLIVGFTAANNCFLKIKPNGDTIWTKKFDGSIHVDFSAIHSTIDGNFLITGGIMAGGWLAKIKPNGDTLWTKSYGGMSNDKFSALQTTPDGNILIVGEKTSDSIGYVDGWLVKLKSNGDTLWTKTFGGAWNDRFTTIQPTSEGNYLIAGSIGYCGWLLKIKPNGDTLWTKTFSESEFSSFCAIQSTADGNFLMVGNPTIICIIADQYAYKDSRFTYKIPVYSTDTLNFGYAPLKVPSGMTLSAGGTVSWTPKTDSVYMDHAEFLVMNDAGKKDTLTFNIFVNSAYHPSIAIKPSKTYKPESKPFEINMTPLTGRVTFSVPSFVKSLTIYDMSGRMVGKVAPVISGSDACAVWPNASSNSSAISTGRYFAKAVAGKNTAVKPFLLVR